MRPEMASIPIVGDVQKVPDIQRAALCCIELYNVLLDLGITMVVDILK